MRRATVLVALVLPLAGCTGGEPQPAPPAPTRGTFTALPAMGTPRAAHTATLLPDGRVLVVGGCISPGCGGTPRGGRTDIFDPRTDTFTPGPALHHPRVGHTATPLADGRVLILGGWPDEGQLPLSFGELYAPPTGRFTDVGPMRANRGGHTATALADGRVLIVGGEDGAQVLADVELWDPATGAFSRAAPMPLPRTAHAATLLRDGRVLVVGGRIGPSMLTDTAVLYDPGRDAWTSAGRLHEAKYKLAVVGLPDGGALVVGGQTGDAREARRDTTEIFDPKNNTFRAGPTMAEPRFKISDAVVALSDGRVVIGGGGTTVEVYEHGRLRLLDGRLGGERQFPAVTALRDGTVLITGGYDNRTIPTAEAFLVVPGG
jgi:hypothetical protein